MKNKGVIRLAEQSRTIFTLHDNSSEMTEKKRDKNIRDLFRRDMFALWCTTVYSVYLDPWADLSRVSRVLLLNVCGVILPGKTLERLSMAPFQ